MPATGMWECNMPTSQYQTHGSRSVFMAAKAINKTDIPVLRVQEFNSLQQVPSPTQLWDGMHRTVPPKHQTWRGALLTAPKMTPWRCSTAVSPAWGPAWLHHPLLLPPLPIAIPTAIPSPRVSAGIPGVLHLLHHTQRLQQGTHQGGIFRTPLSLPFTREGTHKRSK